MKRQLKCLDDTIAEIEREIKKNPDRFLISTLERLKLYRDYDMTGIGERVERVQMLKRRQEQRGFRGYGMP